MVHAVPLSLIGPSAGPADRPEELTTLEDGEKQETDRNMEAMWHLLKDVGGRWAASMLGVGGRLGEPKLIGCAVQR